MKRYLKEALSLSTADFTDLRYEKTRSMAILLSKGEVKNVSSTVIEGGQARALKKGGIAYRSFTDIASAGKAVGDACRGAAVMGRSGRARDGLLPAPVIKDDVKPNPKVDPRQVTFEEKQALAQEYAKLAQSVPGVMTTTITYSERFSEETLVNSDGSEISQELLLCRIGGRIVAKEGERVEMTSFSVGYDQDFAKLQKRHDIVERKAKTAVELLKSERIKPGMHTIVCDPDLSGIFTHEAFGHLSEADDVVNNPSLQESMKLGRVLGKPILNIVDQGNFPGAPGTYPYDQEGVPTQKTYLIKEGVLVDRLHSRNTAFRLGGKPTGNYRAASYRLAPIVRQSNIFIENGATSFADMLASVDKGYYLCGGKGGQTMGDLFTFGAWYGWEIRKGKLGKMVCEINLSGNVFNTLGNIVAIGNDFEMNEWGGCGKTRAALYDMQMLAKSGTGGPHIKIENVVIGGR
ncbi:MAG: TldD/PmbA family protein [Planctomycetes bacterium]|nr:TldD/PmbA family protein [Planctomycetota bacterium]